MEEIFVTKVRINKVLHLENLEIPLSDTERKHLILTGKNGSGKTSVLKGIVTFLDSILAESASITEIELIQYVSNALSEKKLHKDSQKDPAQWGRTGQLAMSALPKLKEIEEMYPVQLFSKLDLYNKNGSFQSSVSSKNFILKFFEAKRDFNPKESDGPKKIDIDPLPDIRENVNKDLVQHLINQRYAFLNLKEEGEIEQAAQIEKWFQDFEGKLKDIFEDESLEFVHARHDFNYNIVIKNRNPFNINQLSDGYGMFLSIISEIMMRMDNQSSQIYNLQGIVLIDEIETHLHIDLQKKILPFLTAFFPKIQFIVTTHSPFVLSSIDNAVIYDLEKQQTVEDLSDYSYQEIVETYFGTDQYSDFVKKKLAEYELLIQKSGRSEEDEEKIYELRKYFRKLPFFLSPELQLKIQSLELYPEIAHT